MSKIRKFVISALVLALVLTCIPATAAFAQENEMPTRRGILLERVSEILNIDQQELKDAFKQALAEMPRQDLDARLQELVSAGAITQDQANQFETWAASRPDVPKVGPRGLKRLLDQGKISQEQMEQYKAWLIARPNVADVDRKGIRNLVSDKRQERRDMLTAEVAQILNIDQQTLEDAFKQAIGEARVKVLDTRLEKLVSDGTLTQQQADAYKSWIEARPDVPRIWPTRR